MCCKFVQKLDHNSGLRSKMAVRISQGRRTLQDKMLPKTIRFNLRQKGRRTSITERHTDYQLLDPINCKQETARCSDHGLTYYVEYTGSCQCMECDLAIHSPIHRIQRESKAKCFILFLSYINCYVATFEGCINSVKSVHFCFENILFSGKIC